MTQKMTYHPDPIVEGVINKMRMRSMIGQIKYGTTMERTDLDDIAWYRHHQEELMDGIIYAERIIQNLLMETSDGK